MKKVLVFAAHPDDEIIGCGGTLLKYKEKGYKLSIVFFTDGISSRFSKNKVSTNKIEKLIKLRKKQALKVGKRLEAEVYFHNFEDNVLDQYPLLKVVKIVEEYKNKLKPNIVLTHYYNDLNVDHQVISKAVITAFRPKKTKYLEALMLFEILSSTENSIVDNFRPNCFINISSQIKRKINLAKIYDKEIRKNHGRSPKLLNSLSEYRSNRSPFDHVESFYIYSSFIK